MKTPGLKTFNIATCLALWASLVVPLTAQSSDDSPLLPIEVKCPVEGSQNYAQVFRRADGLTIRYSIKYDGDTAIEVRAEVASESVFRIVDEIDLLSPTTDDEKKALAAAIISRNQQRLMQSAEAYPPIRIAMKNNCKTTLGSRKRDRDYRPRWF